MALTATSNRNQHNGDGATTVFPFTFTLPAGSTGSDVEVRVYDASNVETVLSSNYSVDTVNSTVTYPTVGGQAPLAAGQNALPAGWSIVIRRIEPLTQVLALSSQGVFDADSIETAFDKLTMILQQIQEQLNRSLQYPANITPTAAQLNPTALTVSINPLIISGTLAQLKARAQAAPTVQFFCFATDMGSVGQLGFYIGSMSIGDEGFFFLGGG